MSLFSLSRRLLSVLLPLAITVTVYLYLYPIFHGCAFPLPRSQEAGEKDGNGKQSSLLATLRQHVSTSPSSSSTTNNPEPQPAIFRLLVLADPQLEGDSSLPSPDDALLARIRKHWTTIKDAAQHHEEDDNLLAALSAAWNEFISSDIPRTLRAARKRLDLLGNDYYLAHIYRTLHWWTRPSHVTVLGDLIGSQWVTDEEFEWRGRRFWERVFRGGERVGDEVTRTGVEGYNKMQEDPGLEELGAVDSTWARKIINIAGNHDIGYSGDASEARLERFERVFGRANWDIRFQHPPIHNQENSTITPTLHLINLNTLTLDSPAFSQDIQTHGYNYVNDLISHRTYPVEDRTTFTLLLTHLPLHKQDGICTDGPYFTYHESDDEDGPEGIPRFRAEGLREQNHLSEHISANGVLQGIFGMSGDEDAPVGGRGRNGLILTGHDHTGCDVVHFVDQSMNSSTAEDGTEDSHDDSEEKKKENESWKWNAKRYTHHHTPNNHHNTSHGDKPPPSIREVTLRSMMGEYGGNAGLLSIWFDARPSVNEWKYEITMCAAGVQHIWWVVHVVDVVTVVVVFVYLVSGLAPPPLSSSLELEREKVKGQVNGGSATTKELQQTQTETQTQTQTQTRQESKTQ